IGRQVVDEGDLAGKLVDIDAEEIGDQAEHALLDRRRGRWSTAVPVHRSSRWGTYRQLAHDSSLGCRLWTPIFSVRSTCTTPPSCTTTLTVPKRRPRKAT